nr:substrate-binding domain-containing protein [Micromonospora sp. DSM 115978]
MRYRKLTMMVATAAALTLVTTACTSANPDADEVAGGDGSTDFYADFTPPTVPTEEGLDTPVDTSAFKKPEGKELLIGYSDASLGNSWRVMAKAETEYGIKELGNARLIYTNSNDSVPKQIADMDDLIAQKVDAIILAAVDDNALCPSIGKATAAGIPVIIQERRVNCDNYTVWVSDNAPEVSLFQMEYVAQQLGGKGKIAIISGIAGAGHSVQMEEGYANVLKNYPDIDVVATEYSDYDPAKAREVTSALLTANPDLDAVAAISGNIGIGVFQAIQAAGKVNQMKAWTGDDANGWMLIQAENNLPGMTVSLPPKAGRVAVEIAGKILRGEPVNSTVQVEKWASPVELSKNITEYANKDRSDEWWYTDLPCADDPFCK